MLNKYCSSLVVGLLLFILFHTESISFGPLKVSHLWKGLLLAFLLVKIFSHGRLKKTVYTPLLLLSLLTLFSLELVYNTPNAVFSFSTTVIIPLIGIYALQRDPAWCRRALYFLSTFFILCFIPYELGLLTPLGEGYGLERAYGVDVEGSIGPFQTVHSASTALAGSLIVVLYFWLTSTYNRIWLSFLFLLGFYLLFNTYVRTGMAMFVIGALTLLVSEALRSHKMFLRVALLVAALVPLVGGWVLANDALMARILGERTHSSELSSFETIGSGRGGLALSALEIYAEANVVEKLIGMGITEQKRRMSEKVGGAFIPHNGFLGVLLHTGLIGFVLFMTFLRQFWVVVRGMPNKQSKAFLKGLLLAYIVMTFFQQYDMLYMLVLMMLGFAWKRLHWHPAANCRFHSNYLTNSSRNFG